MGRNGHLQRARRPGLLTRPSRGIHTCLVTQSCPTLCGSLDCSPPGSSLHGILQARILEWVAMPSSRGSPGSAALQAVSLPTEPRRYPA